MNYALSLQEKGFTRINAIDINQSKQNYFMGVSGVKVLSPEFTKKKIDGDSIIIVMNPNHYKFAQQLFSRSNLITAGRILWYASAVYKIFPLNVSL